MKYAGLWSDGVDMLAGVLALTAGSGGSYVRVFPLDAGTRMPRTMRRSTLRVSTSSDQHVRGIWSDRTTMWVSSPLAENSAGTLKVLRAYVAAGVKANSPAFFGVARFADDFATSVAENTEGYALDLRVLDLEDGPNDLTLELSGVDAGLFEVSSDKKIVLKDGAVFNFESPADMGTDANDNVYELTVTVTDSKNDENDPDPDADDTVNVRITVTDTVEFPPDAPTALMISDETYDSLGVSWTAPPEIVPPLTDYAIQWRKAGQVPADVWKDATYVRVGTGATIGRLPDYDTSYEVRVAAVNGVLVNGVNHGEWSAIANGATNRRKPDDDILLHADNDAPQGMSSDGTSLWVTDSTDDVLYRHNLADLTAAATTFSIADAPGGSVGVWSNGATVWVAPDSDGQVSRLASQSRCTDADDCVQAYDIATGNRQGPKEVQLPDGTDFSGLWSDGEILWVLDTGDDSVIPFDLATGERLSGRDITFDDEMASFTFYGGVWSDGVRMWVATGILNDGPVRLESHVRVYPLEGLAEGVVRPEAYKPLDFEVGGIAPNAANGIWSDRDTLWVSSVEFRNDDATRRVLHAYVAKGAVANSPAFFGAARFADTLAVEVAENTTGYRLDLRPGDADDELSDLTLELSGDDAGLFDMDADGVITPKAGTTFDFEDPADGGTDAGDNAYELTVTITDLENADGGDDPVIDQTVNITITITNVDEAPGTITLNPAEPVVLQQITASLTDPDAVTADNPTGEIDPGWQWQVADADSDNPFWQAATGTGVNTNRYTPARADLGRLLRVSALYSERHL